MKTPAHQAALVSFGLLFAIDCAPASAQAPEPPSAERAVALESTVMHALVSRTPIAGPIVTPVQPPPQAVNVWRGNRPLLSSTIDRADLTFEGEAPSNSEDELLTTDLFDKSVPPSDAPPPKLTTVVTLRFDNEGISVASNQTRDAAIRGGVKLKYKPDKLQSFFIDGKATGFGIFLPPQIPRALVTSSAGDTRAIVLCPRHATFAPRSRTFTGLKESSARLTQVALRGSADAVGGLSVVAPSLLRAEVLLGPGFKTTEHWKDEVIASNVHAEIRYASSELKDAPAPAPHQKFSSRLTARLFAHLSSGWSRVSEMSTDLWVSPTTLGNSLSVPIRQTFVSLGAGSCLIIMRETTTGDRYGRAPFVRPPDEDSTSSLSSAPRDNKPRQELEKSVLPQ